MDYLELQSFVTICDCRSITEASRRLYITQPALSRRIHDLEEELGVTLFLRKSKGIEITETGKRLYHDAVHLLQQTRHFSTKARYLHNSKVGSLRIAVSPEMPYSPVLRGISTMARDYPEVLQTFKTDLPFGFPSLLIQKQVDVVLCGKGEILGVQGIPYEILYEHSLSAYVGERHRLWKNNSISWEDFSGETVAIYSGHAQNAEGTIELIIRKNCPSIKNVYYCKSVEESMLCAATSQSIALCGAGECEYLPMILDVLKNIPIEGPSIDWGSPIAAYDQDNPFALTFINYVKEEFCLHNQLFGPQTHCKAIVNDNDSCA